MEIDDAVKGRRDVRKYLAKVVPERIVRNVLEAGTWAPSAKNGQQWRFTVLTGSSKEELATFFHRELDKYQRRSAWTGQAHRSTRVAQRKRHPS